MQHKPTDYYSRFVHHYRKQLLEGKLPQGWQQSVIPDDRASLTMQFCTNYCILNLDLKEMEAMRASAAYEVQALNAARTKEEYINNVKQKVLVVINTGQKPLNARLHPREEQQQQPRLNEGEESVEMVVPDQAVGIIVGRGAQTIRNLQQRSGCHINIRSKQMDVNGLRPVTLTGSDAACTYGKELIMEIVDKETNQKQTAKTMGKYGDHAGENFGNQWKVERGNAPHEAKRRVPSCTTEHTLFSKSIRSHRSHETKYPHEVGHRGGLLQSEMES